MVALSGDATGEALIRRGARMAARVHGELLAVHVRTPDGTVQTEAKALDAQRTLLAEMGGTYCEVTGADVATALISFAVAEDATQLLLANRWHNWLYHVTHGSMTTEVIRRVGPIDVHVISGVRRAAQGSAAPPARPDAARPRAGHREGLHQGDGRRPHH